MLKITESDNTNNHIMKSIDLESSNGSADGGNGDFMLPTEETDILDRTMSFTKIYQPRQKLEKVLICISFLFIN